MKIIIDAMGGDHAPLAPIQGAALAVAELGVEVILVGREEELTATIQKNNISMNGLSIVNATDVISMEDDATDVVRKRPNSSLAIGLNMLAKEEGDALVSAGSTGALLVGATLIVKRIKGVKRAAIGTMMPGGQKPWLLIDAGANVDCRPDMLVQFAAMGTAYQEKVNGLQNPTVGLVNNGTEETKGTNLQLQTYPLLKNSGMNFAGNIEPREVPSGVVDVVVCDGFTGNVILKLTEGVAKMLGGMIKEMMMKSTKTKLAALMLKDGLKEFKSKMDYTEYGGAPLLGIRKPVIKAHGSSDANAIKNAIRQAKTCAEKDVAGSIETWIEQQKSAEAAE